MSTPSISTIELGSVDWPEALAFSAERVVSGAPSSSTVIIDETPDRQLGLWKVWPGEFTTVHENYTEFIHVIEGSGSLVDSAGIETRLEAGTTVLMEPGWAGRWVIRETLTKVFSVLY